MSNHVVVLSTQYDNPTYYLHEWAAKLRDDLLASKAVASCLLVDATTLCHAGSTFSDVADRASHIVFYGHGEADKWLALPKALASTAFPLVDVPSVSKIQGKHVYAACCFSLKTLGPAFSVGGLKDFVGYDRAFNFSVHQQEEFRRIVHYSVRDFILGKKPVAQIVKEQRDAWHQLELAFSKGGMFANLLDASFAASCARSNAGAIGNA